MNLIEFHMSYIYRVALIMTKIRANLVELKREIAFYIWKVYLKTSSICKLVQAQLTISYKIAWLGKLTNSRAFFMCLVNVSDSPERTSCELSVLSVVKIVRKINKSCLLLSRSIYLRCLLRFPFTRLIWECEL